MLQAAVFKTFPLIFFQQLSILHLVGVYKEALAGVHCGALRTLHSFTSTIGRVHLRNPTNTRVSTYACLPVYVTLVVLTLFGYSIPSDEH